MVIYETYSCFEHKSVESWTDFTEEYDIVCEENGADADGAKINSQTRRIKFLSKVVDKKGTKVAAYKVDIIVRKLSYFCVWHTLFYSLS